LRWPSANSKHFCARQPSEPFRVFDEQFAHSCHDSVRENVPITSGMRDMLQYERETQVAIRRFTLHGRAFVYHKFDPAIADKAKLENR
jgi:hypothetical protein